MAKYKTLLSRSENDVQNENIAQAVGQAELQLKADILATESQIGKAEIILKNAMGANPLNSQAIIKAQVELEGLNDGLERLQKLQKELF